MIVISFVNLFMCVCEFALHSAQLSALFILFNLFLVTICSPPFSQVCHSGACAPCALSRQKTCPCGKQGACVCARGCVCMSAWVRVFVHGPRGCVSMNPVSG